ncbi:hypothetical protein FIBSPDRAFT_1052802 [Athelia psychrophila]|uniref:G domain-containing protein n=1 Tax=Athelia psychrophila TaxID=1759441 RepID=A0A165WMH0_9AGAM|nr:hypothetical protein FIBSPDRAFT_1052802 [Fibularhizoctonia sp. CBS 109695]
MNALSTLKIDVIIAVMGATGSGKTTLVNLISGSKLQVGRGLRSCTSNVEATAPFDFQGRRVVLFDTPGFDGTTKSDTDILKLVAAFLATTYEHGATLSGVIYMHRINDVRMGGIAVRNFGMFRKLCGDDSLKNVAIVTNFWSEVDPAVGDAREAELRSDDMFFKPVFTKHAKLLRHDGTLAGARKIVAVIVDNNPMALRIQEELVDEHKGILETAAGSKLNREVEEQGRKRAEELKQIQEDMEVAAKERDEETRQELEAAEKALKAEMERVHADSLKLAVEYSEDKARMEQHIMDMLDVAKASQTQMEQLPEQFQAHEQMADAEREQMQKQVADLKRGNGEGGNKGPCIIACSDSSLSAKAPSETNAPNTLNPDVTIAVMGATGSGKTAFINLLSGSELRVGRGIQSCTSVVQAAAPFTFQGRRVLLFDTPGFDTMHSDSDILKMIAAFLASTYEQGATLSGVIYMHRISDVRVGGISRRNFSMFRKLCGDDSLKNVALVTNMWSEVDPAVGDAREAELRSKDIFFKPVLDKHAQLLRHDGTLATAQAIVAQIVDNHPMALRIQEELVDEHKDISETAAGTELNRELAEQARKHKEELKLIREEMQVAIKERDEETRQELEAEAKKLKAEMQRVQTDSQKLAAITMRIRRVWSSA